ncbi:MAG: OmpP1/FadL family transporter [Halothiobacillaceae bacterium]
MTSALKRSVLATAIATLVAAPAYATNGMNMEAYGAKAGGMGGASMAYDSGNSALMNNPATLALKKEGSDFGIGLTLLSPDVKSSTPNMPTAESSGNAYLMPSMSWIKKSGAFAFGAGMVAQGGMGTEYGRNSFLSPSGQEVRSEVAFGRLMAPLAYKVNDQLSIAGQLDFIWASMDLQMDMMANQLGAGMMSGDIVASGTVMQSPQTGQLMQTPNAYMRFNLTNDNKFSGATTGSGFGAKIGVHYQLNKEWAFGATYHTKTSISDLRGRGSLEGGVAGQGNQVMAVGSYTIKDFQWPATFAMGAAWNVSPNLMLVADYKRIGWSDTMENFSVNFEGDNGATLDVKMAQKWKDQDVYMIGAQYKVLPNLALRVGYNYASKPIEDRYLNPLFPAIIESHYTLGVGWQIDKANSLAASLAYAPEVEQTNPGMPPMGIPAVSSSHSQTTWRVNYNYHF